MSGNNPKQVMMIADNRDAIVNILSRLPLKSLLKCKSVCKWWQFLISDHSFICDYSLRSPHHYVYGLFLQKYLLFPLYPDLEFIGLHGHAEFALEASLSFIDYNEGVHIENSCNGLLLCCSNFQSQETDCVYYICKPTTKQYVALPKLPRRSIVFSINVVFDPTKSLHYKVVCICDSELSKRHRQIHVYLSETGLWKPSGDPFFVLDDLLFNWGDFNRSNDRGVYWNGALHWIGRGETSLRYDVEGESLLDMPIPPIPNGRAEKRLIYFGESRGHLHLIQICGPRTTRFDVLEMKSDYSEWFVKYNVDLRDGTFAGLRGLSPRLMNMDRDLGLQYTWEDVHHYTNTILYL